MPTTTIQHKRDTAAIWAASGRILATGQLGVETDTGKFKIGDGTNVWTALSYRGGPVSAYILTLLDDADAATARGTLLVDPPAVLYGAADVDDDYDTNTTLANMAGIAVTLPTAGRYEVEGLANYSATNTAVGLKLGLTCSNLSSLVIRVELNGDGTTFVNGLIVASGGSVSETATPAGGNSVVHWRGYVRTSSSNGVLQMQGARNTDTGDHTVTVDHAVLRARLIPD